MSSTGLEMRQNRPGLHWGSLRRSPRPVADGEGANRSLPKNPTPATVFRVSALRASLSRLTNTPKINPSYGFANAAEP